MSLANTEDTEIIINELASEIPETGFFALGPDNYHEYTKEELFDYYGIEFDISSVFPDMIEENTGSYGIFKFSDGSDMQGHNFIYSISTAFCSAILEVEMMMGRAICPVGKADAAVAAAR